MIHLYKPVPNNFSKYVNMYYDIMELGNFNMYQFRNYL